jgi:hypothetical protein
MQRPYRLPRNDSGLVGTLHPAFLTFQHRSRFLGHHMSRSQLGVIGRDGTKGTPAHVSANICMEGQTSWCLSQMRGLPGIDEQSKLR